MSINSDQATAQKALEVLTTIAKRVAKEPDFKIALSHDWGFGSATVELAGGHTHIGDDDGTDAERMESFIRDLHALLIDGRGLSLA